MGTDSGFVGRGGQEGDAVFGGDVYPDLGEEEGAEREGERNGEGEGRRERRGREERGCEDGRGESRGVVRQCGGWNESGGACSHICPDRTCIIDISFFLGCTVCWG